MSESNGQKLDLPAILGAGISPVPVDDEASDKCPTLSQLLLPTYRDGQMMREGGAVTVRAAGTDWLVTIMLPTEHVTISLIIPSIVDLSASIERCLAAGSFTYDRSWKDKKKARNRLDKLL